MVIDSQNRVHPDLQTPDSLLCAMDHAGVDMAVVYCVLDSLYDNDYTAAAVAQHPDRFIGLAYINPTREYWKDELRRTVEKLGLRGIKLNPLGDRYNLGIGSHWFMDELFSYCIENDLVVLCHGQGDNPYTMPYQFQDVAWAFPDLKLIMAHMGMMGGYGDAQRVARQNANVYVNTATTTSSQTRMAVRTAGADKVLMGTEGPDEYFGVEIRKVEMGVPDSDERELVLGRNAARLFGLRS